MISSGGFTFELELSSMSGLAAAYNDKLLKNTSDAIIIVFF